MRLIGLGLAAALIPLGVQAASAPPTAYRAHLASLPHGYVVEGRSAKAATDAAPATDRVVSVQPPEGVATAQLAGPRLTVTGRFAALGSRATLAELRQGVAVGAGGPAIASLKAEPEADGQISGEVRLTPAQARLLRAGRLYVQVASEAHPDGAVRGWLLPSTEAGQ